MIKHIFELDRQAQEYAAMELATVNTGGAAEFNRLYMNKFAELIVRECADVELYWLNEQNRKAVAEKIKQHFGVEE